MLIRTIDRRILFVVTCYISTTPRLYVHHLPKIILLFVTRKARINDVTRNIFRFLPKTGFYLFHNALDHNDSSALPVKVESLFKMNCVQTFFRPNGLWIPKQGR